VAKAVLLTAVAAGALFLARGRADPVAATAPMETLQERIDAAAAEDIIVVDGGVYRERIIIDKPISVIGRNWPVIDGGGQGDVVTITADDAFVSGFEIRNSGTSLSTEPAAIKVTDADRVKITGNRVRRSHFALHMTGSAGSAIEANDFRPGSGVPEERRGHALYLWKVTGSTIYRNTIRDAADGIHLEFADDNLIVENDVRESRYALHFMYAHRNKIVRNASFDNLSGAVLMFSHELIVKDNEFSSNRDGASGAGMLLKDDDNIFVEGNRMLRNRYGMTVEGTPQSAGATAIFRRNLYALNDVALALTSNAPVTFVENAVIDNGVQVKALSGELTARTASEHGGAGSAPANGAAKLPQGAVWSSGGRGNYWSDYRGYDANGDGTGDQPYLPRPSFAGRLGEDDALRLFQFTPAQQALDMAADLFPVFKYNAVIEDPAPLMRPPSGLALDHRDAVNRPMFAAGVLLVAGAAAGIVWLSGADGPRVRARAGGAIRPGVWT
jgi:nitrous oxidase accessory protein